MMYKRRLRRFQGLLAAVVLLAVPVLVMGLLSPGTFRDAGLGDVSVPAVGPSAGPDGLLMVSPAACNKEVREEEEVLLRDWNYTASSNSASEFAPGHGGTPPGQAKKEASPAEQSAKNFAPGQLKK